MAQSHLVAGVLGVLLTVASYEIHRAWTRTGAAKPSASGQSNTCAVSEDAYQRVADSLARCQERLAAHESPFSPGMGPSTEITAATAAAPPPYAGDRFDPSPDEWKTLADEGRVKLSRPCAMTDDWMPAPEELHSVGLGPSDATAVADAYKAAAARAWEATRTQCAEWLGVETTVAERIGASTCESLLDMAAQKDMSVFRRVAETRAGRRKEGTLPPVERYYLAKTKELEDFESDLAKRVGADATRKITESSTFCMYRELWPELPQ
ncbi:hypothetical protein LVJ94_13875 [Pendulispora rubella]|uniref:Uncharacterized protein n=1 Tax=Pendulispora rubella TaxID=2741070 RepID=A0ABZ2LD94_9BACT